MSEAVFVKDAYKEFGNFHGPLSRLVQRLETSSGHGSHHRVNPGLAPVVVALDHVSFQVEQGEIFGVLGVSGSGKSTLIRMLATLLVPDSGDLRIFNYDVIQQADQVQRLINRVSVEASFFKMRSPVENLIYSARLHGTSRREARRQAEQLLVRLGASAQAIHMPMDTLPRDIHQKVTIARAMLSRQRLLLLDEPTQSLNPMDRRIAWAVLRELRDQTGTTILLTTCDAQEAESLCDRVVRLHQGKIIQDYATQLQRKKYEHSDAII